MLESVLPQGAGGNRTGQLAPQARLLATRAVAIRGLPATLFLEVQFESHLRNARSVRTNHVAEGWIVDIAVHSVRPKELSVIKGVKGLEAEFQRLGFS